MQLAIAFAASFAPPASPLGGALSERPLGGALRMHRATAARMLVDATAFMTPVGPFCPFRSDACALNGNMDSSMNSLTSKSASFMADMARFQLEAQMGSMPDPERVRNVANGLSEAHAEWETLMQRMRLSGDFQSREYFKMTQAHLKTQGQSLEAIGMAMRWQVDTMKAFADGRPPPNPPVGLDMEAMAKQAQQGSGGGMASALGGPPTIDAPPFDQGAAFDSPVVKEEYEKLCRDHDGLIRMGASYGSFDPLGKVAFLDALEAVEARWDTFFARFALMGTLNADFKQQCDSFLSSMGLSTSEFRKLLGSAHEAMRADAEEERLQAA